MPFLGERQVGKEIEPEPRVQVQFVYYPGEPAEQVRSLSVIEQAAASFFSDDHQIQNIFLIKAPPLPGINIPHFHEWVERTGRYFEGYAQHTVTGYYKSEPLDDATLAKSRAEIEDSLERGPAPAEESQEQLFFFGALVTLDRLAQQKTFIFEIEPYGTRDVIGLYKAVRRLLRTPPTREDDSASFESEAEITIFLEECRLEATRAQREGIEIFASRNSAFHKFLDRVIKRAIRSGRQVKIFIPQEINDFPFDQAKIGQTDKKRPKAKYLNPQFINTTEEEACQSPQVEVTREEVVKMGLEKLIEQALSVVGLEHSLENHPNFLDNCTHEELHALLVQALLNKDIDRANIALLRFFSQRTGGSDYANLYIFMRSFWGDDKKDLRDEAHGLLRRLFDAHRPKED